MTPTNAVLDEKIKNMQEQNNKEHSEIKEMLSLLNGKFDKLDSRYPTRREFKSVSFAIWLLATLIGVAWYFLNK